MPSHLRSPRLRGAVLSAALLLAAWPVGAKAWRVDTPGAPILDPHLPGIGRGEAPGSDDAESARVDPFPGAALTIRAAPVQGWAAPDGRSRAPVLRRPVPWFGTGLPARLDWPARLGLYLLYGIVGLICVYAVRHYLFTYNRLFGRQRHPYLPIDDAEWPWITVLIPCHNEEAVVHHILDSLLSVDYPRDRMTVVPINDRSTDRTAEILDRYAARFPETVRPMHRRGGAPGKAAALQDAIAHVQTEVVLVFDADYLPGPDLVKRLAAPFLDPETGAVMGRVVPLNTPRNLLTRMLDLERSAGYQVDQQARMNLRAVPQYGGTVGGVRVSALRAVGGWREDALAEDTDITMRLLLGGWKIVYSNRYECYEEVPETWPVRIRQITRWARGHTDAAIRYLPDLLRTSVLSPVERMDAVLLLCTYLMSPVLLLGWALAVVLFLVGANPFSGVIAILGIASYGTLGNFAAFFEIGAAVRLDGVRHRIRLLPLVLGGFLVSLVSTSRAVMQQVFSSQGALKWDKTERFRHARPAARAPMRPRADMRPASAYAPDRPHARHGAVTRWPEPSRIAGPQAGHDVVTRWPHLSRTAGPPG